MKFALRFAVAAALICTAAAAHAWDDFQIIEWQPRDAAQLATLKRLGVTAATVVKDRKDGIGTPEPRQMAPILAADLRWYVENIATDFYSAYHRWSPGRVVNWRFVEIQRRYQQNPDDETALWRDPSFTDTAWQRRIHERLIATVRTQSRYHPLYYSLGDETGIADLSAYWDFDMSPGSLAGMRTWLRQGYGSLAALNDEWGTRFRQWDDVRPETTRQAMRRQDDNFAAWADFKAWMDVSYARALRMGTDAVHQADRRALAAIEGVQVPGWGGYDYSLLVHAVDAMEVDDVPLAHSLNPRLTTLTTSFGASPLEIHDIWRDLLAGTRGLILWDAKGSIVGPDAQLRERGQAYGETFAQIRGGIGKLLLGSAPHTDPVAILYSPPSFRTQWMLEQKPKGDAWMSRDSETEIGPNAARDAMWAYQRAVMHLGLEPSFLSPQLLGELRRRGIRVLILPHAIALSPDEARLIHRFAAGGGTVIVDVQPGVFDAHSRRLAQPSVPADTFRVMAPKDLQLDIAPPLRVAAPDRDVTVHLWRHGGETIVGVQRDYAAGSEPETVVVTLPTAGTVFDLRKGQSLGRLDRIPLTLDPVYPALLSITP